MARAYVELPDGWGPQQEIAMALHRDGYVRAKPDVVKRFGRPDLLPIPQNDEGPHGGGPLDRTSI